MSVDIKQAIHHQCLENIQQRRQHALEAIAMARQSANEEGKSSAGDKHETGRAMAQLEQEKAGKQLQDLEDLLAVIKRLDPSAKNTTVVMGSLAYTSNGIFYLSVAAGKISLSGIDYYAISPASPMGAALLGNKANAEVSLNGKTLSITAVF